MQIKRHTDTVCLLLSLGIADYARSVPLCSAMVTATLLPSSLASVWGEAPLSVTSIFTSVILANRTKEVLPSLLLSASRYTWSAISMIFSLMRATSMLGVVSPW